MRVLLDENLPHDLASLLSGHDVATVQGARLGRGYQWRAVASCERSDRRDMTMDRKLERQQNLGVLSFGIVVLRARSNRLADRTPLVDGILVALEKARPGNVQHVGA